MIDVCRNSFAVEGSLSRDDDPMVQDALHSWTVATAHPRNSPDNSGETPSLPAHNSQPVTGHIPHEQNTLARQEVVFGTDVQQEALHVVANTRLEQAEAQQTGHFDDISDVVTQMDIDTAARANAPANNAEPAKGQEDADGANDFCSAVFKDVCEPLLPHPTSSAECAQRKTDARTRLHQQQHISGA